MSPLTLRRASSERSVKVLFLTPYPSGAAPSQRFRFEQYYHLLSEAGIAFETRSFWDEKGWYNLYKKGKALSKLWAIIKGFAKRKSLVYFGLSSYDLVFIHREAAPIGPPFFEWWITKVAKKRVVYDFDDAIWLPNTSRENRIIAGLKWHGKVVNICKWSWKVSCGNDFLADFARMYNAEVTVNPTTIDTTYHRRIPNGDEGRVVVGWTGSHSTITYLEQIAGVLEDLVVDPVTFLHISNREWPNSLKRAEFIKWKKESEISDLSKLDIGLMPMPDDDWTRGKCGLKVLQYMALGIPVVASPVGANLDIIEECVNGFFADSPATWRDRLRQLIDDPDLRRQIGEAGRKTVAERYSISANAENFMSLFNQKLPTG